MEQTSLTRQRGSCVSLEGPSSPGVAAGQRVQEATQLGMRPSPPRASQASHRPFWQEGPQTPVRLQGLPLDKAHTLFPETPVIGENRRPGGFQISSYLLLGRVSCMCSHHCVLRGLGVRCIVHCHCVLCGHACSHIMCISACHYIVLMGIDHVCSYANICACI